MALAPFIETRARARGITLGARLASLATIVDITPPTYNFMLSCWLQHTILWLYVSQSIQRYRHTILKFYAFTRLKAYNDTDIQFYDFMRLKAYNNIGISHYDYMRILA